MVLCIYVQCWAMQALVNVGDNYNRPKVLDLM
jgi:hypothetical protein